MLLTIEVVLTACARAVHEANRAYCIACGDMSQLPWDYAPEWLRVSVEKGVREVIEGNTPEQSHECWLREKQETGWKYGPLKDVSKKEHPCMVPYSELPPDQRMKNHMFVTVVRTMYSSLTTA